MTREDRGPHPTSAPDPTDDTPTPRDQQEHRRRPGGRTRTPSRGRARDVTDHDRTAILAAHDEGLSRNAIARRTGRSASTVTRVVTAAGRAFDRTATATATAAAAIDRRAQRIDEAGTLLDALRAVRGRLVDEVRRLTPHELASLARASVDLANAHGRLAELDAGREQEDAIRRDTGMLGTLMTQLRDVAGPYVPPDEVHPPTPAGTGDER